MTISAEILGEIGHTFVEPCFFCRTVVSMDQVLKFMGSCTVECGLKSLRAVIYIEIDNVSVEILSRSPDPFIPYPAIKMIERMRIVNFFNFMYSSKFLLIHHYRIMVFTFTRKNEKYCSMVESIFSAIICWYDFIYHIRLKYWV